MAFFDLVVLYGLHMSEDIRTYRCTLLQQFPEDVELIRRDCMQTSIHLSPQDIRISAARRGCNQHRNIRG